MGVFWFLAPIKKITEHVNIFCILILYIVMINRTFKIHFQHKIPNQNLILYTTGHNSYQVCCFALVSTDNCEKLHDMCMLFQTKISRIYTPYIYCVHQYGRQSRLNLIKLKSHRIKASPRILTYSHASISLQRLIFDTPFIP